MTIPGRASSEYREHQAYRQAFSWARDRIGGWTHVYPSSGPSDFAGVLEDLAGMPGTEAGLRAIALFQVLGSDTLQAAWILSLSREVGSPSDGCGAGIQGDVARCERALVLAREARNLLRGAGASRSYGKARALVSSIGGAIRHAQGKGGDPPA